MNWLHLHHLGYGWLLIFFKFKSFHSWFFFWAIEKDAVLIAFYININTLKRERKVGVWRDGRTWRGSPLLLARWNHTPIITHLDFHNAVSIFEFHFNTQFDFMGSRCLWSRCVACLCCFAAPFKGHVELIRGELRLSSLTLCCVSWTLWVHATCATRGSAGTTLFDLALLHRLQMFRLSKSCHGPRGLSFVMFTLFERLQLVAADRRWANSVKISKINQPLLFYV